MITYKWGKFERIDKYEEYWDSQIIDHASSSSVPTGSKEEGTVRTPNLINKVYYLNEESKKRFSNGERIYFRDYKFFDGMEGTGLSFDFPSNEKTSCDEILKRGYIDVEYSGRYYLTCSGYKAGSSPRFQVLKWAPVLKHRKSGYTKGSKIDTVTSSNRRAYPDNGESGSYWYVYEGIANQEPTISGQDADWGGYKQAFKRYYSVDDGDSGQQLNVVVTLNGVTIATVNNATRKTDYPIDIDDSKFNALTLNEQNTIEITVTDSSGATAVRRYTFKRINTAPVVTMTNAHYGEQNKPFTINFEAADPDGDEITAKLFIDDVQIKDLGTIKGKQSITIPKIDFAKIPNGEHKIRVEVKDSYNAVGAGYADFSKNLNYAWYRLKKELSEQPSAVIVNPLSEVAPGAKMTIKVCSNVMDAQPTWETVPEELYGQKYNFRNTSKTATNWGVGVEIRIDKEKATEESYLYGFVGAYM